VELLEKIWCPKKWQGTKTGALKLLFVPYFTSSVGDVVAMWHNQNLTT
jgi:hypothetical protein